MKRAKPPQRKKYLAHSTKRIPQCKVVRCFMLTHDLDDGWIIETLVDGEWENARHHYDMPWSLESRREAREWLADLRERYGPKPIPQRKADSSRRRFAKHRDSRYSAWITELPCLICQSRPVDPAHIVPRSRGSDDRANLVPLCRKHHDSQEGRTAAFEAEHHIDLKLIAVLLDHQYAEGQQWQQEHGG